MRFPQPGEDAAAAAGKAPGQGKQQGALAAEPLNETAGGDAGLGGDVGERELVGARRVIARCAAARF